MYGQRTSVTILSKVHLSLIAVLPSRWDDNRLHSYLEQKGIIKTKQQATRDELLAKMRSTYASVTDPAYQAWSDFYIVHVLFAIDSEPLTILIGLPFSETGSSPTGFSNPTPRRREINSWQT